MGVSGGRMSHFIYKYFIFQDTDSIPLVHLRSIDNQLHSKFHALILLGSRDINKCLISLIMVMVVILFLP